MFSRKILCRRQLIISTCIASIVQVPICMGLLKITCLHDKAAVVTHSWFFEILKFYKFCEFVKIREI